MTVRILLALLVLLLLPTPTPPTIAVIADERIILEMESPALVYAPREISGRGGLARPITFSRLDIGSSASTTYLNRLQREQESVIQAVRSLAPSVQVERRYGITLNAVAVRGITPEAARRVPGVRKVYADLPYSLAVYPDVEQIGGTVLWNEVGGPAMAGKGIKVAVIDSGIAIQHPSFNPDGYEYPAGYPKGDTTQTTPKVIAARSYIRSDDPAKDGDSGPTPRPGADSHGTHVASTIGGIAGVVASVDGVQTPISGVAPGAYLMNYRVFYPSVSPSDFVTGNAFTVELVAALEDAVRDGADVISNSWGASYSGTTGWSDPMVKALDAVVAAGVVVAQASGNDGPGLATSNNPSNAQSVIAVGAVTTSSEIARDFIQVGDERIRYSRSTFGPRLTQPTAPTTITPMLQENAACATLPPDSLAGSIALVQRGTCSFLEKVLNAQAAGAIGVLFVNTGADRFAPSADRTAGQQARIPSGMVNAAEGARLVATGNTPARIDPSAAIVQTTPDQMADFSSRGPSTDLFLKPDVVAPGVNILAAGYGPQPNPLAGFGQVSGTSMATPHVAGAAALLRQIQPEWAPSRIKAAIMASASTQVSEGGVPVGPLLRGAGRVDLVKALRAPILAEPPSLGIVTSGPTSETIRLTGTGPRIRITPRLEWTGTSVAATITPSSFELGAGETVELTVSVPAELAAGDYGGDIILGDSHVPVWLRVMPLRDRDVLLIDNDGSDENNDLPNTAVAYRVALEATGTAYDLLNVDDVRRGQPLNGQLGMVPPVALLNRYKTVILFTGSRESPVIRRQSLTAIDQAVLADYLNSGGSLMVFGQQVAEATDVVPFQDALYGRSRLFHGYLGAVVRGRSNAGTVAGAPDSPLAGRSITVRGESLPNLDAYREDSDTYFAAETVRPLASSNGTVGLLRAAEPSLEEPRLAFPYRSILFGFGLEQVAEADRAPLLSALLPWLATAPTVQIAPVDAGTEAITLTARVSEPGIRFRWDFGDGSAIQETTTPTIQHRYSRTGRYTPRVEVTFATGHKAVSG